MSPQEIIEALEKKNSAITEEDFYDYFPKMIDDLLDIEENILNGINSLSYDDHVENDYEIHYLMIKYYMEILKIYIKAKYNITINYVFDEFVGIGGSAAYDEEEDSIRISVIGMLVQFINTCSYFQPLLHEFRHKLQHDFYNEEKLENYLNYPAYFILIAKQYLFMTCQQEEFYLDNYTKLYSEIDAEEYSTNELVSIIPFLYQKYQEKQESTEELVNKVSQLLGIIKENSNQIIKRLKDKDRIQTNISEELYGLSDFTSTFLLDGEEVDSITQINQFLKENSTLLKLFPAFQLIMRDDYLKDYQELMQDKKRLLEEIPNIKITPIDFDYPTTTHSQIEELYQTIVRTDPSLQIGEKPKQKTKR